MGPWQRSSKPLGAARPVPGPEQPADPLGGGEWFAVEITDVDGSGASAKYAFTEINVVGGTGGPEGRVSGRVADLTNNPARALDAGVTFAVGDKALARRNVADVNEYELAPMGGGGGEESFLVLLTEKHWTGTFREYSAVEVEASGDITYAVKAGGREFDKDGGGGNPPLYHERNIDFPVVGLSAGSPRFVHRFSVVRVRQNPNGFWYFQDNAWVEIVRRTGSSDADGEVAYERYNSANTGIVWADGEEVRLIEAE